MSEIKIGILICAYNEEKHIRKVVEECLRHIKNVIVVNDGSRDKTLKELKKTKAKIINQKVNKGKGEALKAGFDYAIKKKFRFLNLGLARDVATDGVFLHKRRMGCNFFTGPNSPLFGLEIGAN